MISSIIKEAFCLVNTFIIWKLSGRRIIKADYVEMSGIVVKLGQEPHVRLHENIAFLYIYIYIYMVGLNHQQCKTIFTERFRLSPSSEFTGTRKKIKISTFLQVNQEKTK